MSHSRYRLGLASLDDIAFLPPLSPFGIRRVPWTEYHSRHENMLTSLRSRVGIIAGLSVSLLSACSFAPPYHDVPPPDETGTDWSVSTGTTVMTGASVSEDSSNTESTASGSQSMSGANTDAGRTGDASMDISGGTASLVLDVGTGTVTRVAFEVTSSGGTMDAKVSTPDDPNGNIRISQIEMPDGTTDGPFGTEMSYRLSQTGSYRLILSANQMAGDPWGGRAWLQADVR